MWDDARQLSGVSLALFVVATIALAWAALGWLVRQPAFAFREVVIMRELEEMSYRQIAQVTSLPVGTVMSRLSRARKRLEECAQGRNMESDK